MILKGLIGEILKDLGHISDHELDQALKRQREITKERISRERDLEFEVSSSVGLSVHKEATPMLGVILNYMGFATMEQIEAAVEKQEKMADIYQSLDSKDLGLTIEMSSIVNSALDLKEVLSLILRYTDRLLNSAASTLMLLDEKTGELVFNVPRGLKSEKRREIRIPAGKGIAGWVAKHGKPIWVSDVRDDPRFYPDGDAIFGYETHNILCVPVRGRDKIIGVLKVINKKDGTPFSKSDSLLLNIFAYYAATAIENARIHGELKEHLEEEKEVQKTQAVYEKSRTLGKQASSLGHEFNNLLMNIQGNISLMLLETDAGHPNFKRLKSMEQSVQKGADIAKRLLDLARDGGNEVTLEEMTRRVKNGTGLAAKIAIGPQEKPLPEESPIGKKTVLIVDDEMMILEVGKKMLEKMSHEVFAANSGKEAIEVLEREKDRIDLVVLDMIMPEMGGKETFERLREIKPDVKILISSGYSQGEHTSQILERGGSGFIQKPFTMMELAQKINALFE